MKDKLLDFKIWFRGLFTDPQWEAFKSIVRLIIFLVVSDITVQLLNQAVKVPESLVVKVWVFDYVIPARMLFTTAFTFLLSYLDKLKHLNFKEEHPRSDKSGGVLPF
jgi:hypothetical protein